MNIKCIFFDFDGVIIENSQILFLNTMQQYIKNKSIDLNLEYFIENFLGLKGEVILENLNCNFKVNLSVEDLDVIRHTYKQALINAPKFDNHLIELLNDLQDKFICSSNNKTFINQLLYVTKLKHYFPDNRIYSLESVTKIKPDPLIYLNALRYSKFSSDCCWAIEDSVAGTVAAKQAGLYTIGYLGGLPHVMKKKYAQNLLSVGADRVINSFYEI